MLAMLAVYVQVQGRWRVERLLFVEYLGPSCSMRQWNTQVTVNRSIAVQGDPHGHGKSFVDINLHTGQQGGYSISPPSGGALSLLLTKTFPRP